MDPFQAILLVPITKTWFESKVFRSTPSLQEKFQNSNKIQLQQL